MTRKVSRVCIRNARRKNLSELRKLVMQSKMHIEKKYTINRKILIDVNLGQHEYIFHATKGWRRRKRY